MKNENLKPCPFCGGKAVLKQDSGFDYGSYIYWVECSGCGASSPRESSSPTSTGVVAAVLVAANWNGRVRR